MMASRHLEITGAFLHSCQTRQETAVRPSKFCRQIDLIKEQKQIVVVSKPHFPQAAAAAASVPPNQYFNSLKTYTWAQAHQTN